MEHDSTQPLASNGSHRPARSGQINAKFPKALRSSLKRSHRFSFNCCLQCLTFPRPILRDAALRFIMSSAQCFRLKYLARLHHLHEVSQEAKEDFQVHNRVSAFPVAQYQRLCVLLFYHRPCCKPLATSLPRACSYITCQMPESSERHTCVSFSALRSIVD